MKRVALLGQLAGQVASIRRHHPTRVAVGGFSAAGKTTFADALAEALRARGRHVLRAELDDFHRPGHKFRSMRDEWTPSLYLAEGYDWAAFRSVLLDPISPGGSLRCRTGVFDSYRDAEIPEAWVDVAPDAVVVIDGIFLLGPDLADSFDYRIWLSVRPETILERACARDVAWVGSVEEVRARYEGFWLPAHAHYEERLRPTSRADVVIENDCLEDPRIVTPAWGSGRGR